MALDEKPPMAGDGEDKSSLQPVEVLEFSIEDEERIKKKIDRRLIPALTVLYLLSYLDRGNSQFTSPASETSTAPTAANSYHVANS